MSAFTEVNGQWGHYFTGSVPYDENVPRVFLPAAGSRDNEEGETFDSRGESGHYWSSSCEGTQSRALEFWKTTKAWGTYQRAFGYSVRCVQE